MFRHIARSRTGEFLGSILATRDYLSQTALAQDTPQQDTFRMMWKNPDRPNGTMTARHRIKTSMSCFHSRSRIEVVPVARERLHFELRFRSRTRRFEDNLRKIRQFPSRNGKSRKITGVSNRSCPAQVPFGLFHRTKHRTRITRQTECCGVSCASAVWL